MINASWYDVISCDMLWFVVCETASYDTTWSDMSVSPVELAFHVNYKLICVVDRLFIPIYQAYLMCIVYRNVIASLDLEYLRSYKRTSKWRPKYFRGSILDPYSYGMTQKYTTATGRSPSLDDPRIGGCSSAKRPIFQPPKLKSCRWYHLVI